MPFQYLDAVLPAAPLLHQESLRLTKTNKTNTWGILNGPPLPPPKKMRAGRFQLAAGEAPGRAAYALGNGSQLKRTSPCSYPTMLRKNSPYSPSSSPLKPRPGRVQKPPQRCSTERDHRNVGENGASQRVSVPRAHGCICLPVRTCLDKWMPFSGLDESSPPCPAITDL